MKNIDTRGGGGFTTSLVEIEVEAATVLLLHDFFGVEAVVRPAVTLEEAFSEQTLAVDEGVPDYEVHVILPDDLFHDLHVFLFCSSALGKGVLRST